MKDLIVLVADQDQEKTVIELLKRHRSLKIRPIAFEVQRHPERDAGVFKNCDEFLKPFQREYRYALVMFDKEGCGQENVSVDELQNQVQARLDASGWEGRSAVVVLEPELEAWVFTDSPHIVEVLADGDKDLFDKVLRGKPKSALGKPERPKEAMKEILAQKGIPWSSSLFQRLASQVSLQGCRDPAFLRFKELLRRWFPPESTGFSLSQGES